MQFRFFAIAVVGFASAAFAVPNWQVAAQNDESRVLIDANSLTLTSESTVRFSWQMIDKTPDRDGVILTAMNDEADCAAERSRTLEYWRHGAGGKLVSKSSTPLEWAKVDPESVFAIVFKAVCSASKPSGAK